jgi:diacylglycerol kinase family enzyme
LWFGQQVAVMNAAWLGDLNLGPKAHPNDDLLDVSEGSLPLGQLLLARKRARTGSHLPHPRITMRRVPAVQLHFNRPMPVWLDGQRTGAFRDISVRVEPDALTVVVA